LTIPKPERAFFANLWDLQHPGIFQGQGEGRIFPKRRSPLSAYYCREEAIPKTDNFLHLLAKKVVVINQ
jgi:hypothetical protein